MALEASVVVAVLSEKPGQLFAWVNSVLNLFARKSGRKCQSYVLKEIIAKAETRSAFCLGRLRPEFVCKKIREKMLCFKEIFAKAENR